MTRWLTKFSDSPVATADKSQLPKMVPHGTIMVPEAPRDLPSTSMDANTLCDLVIKLAYTVPQFTTDWATRHLHLPVPIVQDLLEQLRSDQMLDVRGQVGPFNFRYAISQRGCERAIRMLDICGYIGPAPVTLEAYRAMLEWQIANYPPVDLERVTSALAELVISEDALQLAGLAVSSGRSLFIYGQPGNGKTSLGRLVHSAVQGDLWIPHCIGFENTVIRVFDPQCHQPVDATLERSGPIDQRWVRIRRPLIVVGGEVTLESFDLIYSNSLRYYEAPLHVKANGGTFLIDDFGRERADPLELLNRWITPLEHRIDYLTFRTGQKIQVPILQNWIIATNLSPDTVTDPAFLRRIGYRLYLGPPTPEQYARIFERYVQRAGASASPALITRLLDRYRAEGRELRGCEPRDLIERAHDICRFRKQPMELNEEILDLAWKGYFGNK
jgi:hypothetical protein